MTVIAWDGRTMAADKMADSGGMRRTTTKIRRFRWGLIGWSGQLGRALSLVRWVEDGAHPARFPPGADAENWACLLVVRTDGAVMVYEDAPDPIVSHDPWACIGSGRDYAAAAMHLGCTARQAVQVAIDLCTGCGGGIDVLELERGPEARGRSDA